MDKFIIAIKEVQRKCDELLNSQIYKYSNLPKVLSSAGIYVFSKDGIVLYVGRTNNLRRRLQYHTRSNHNQATFAFLLARHQTGRKKATYQQAGSRSELLKNPEFRAAFDKARDDIRAMDIQYILESNPARQALLEICTAMSTRAKYNDFDNH